MEDNATISPHYVLFSPILLLIGPILLLIGGAGAHGPPGPLFRCAYVSSLLQRNMVLVLF